MIPLKLYTWNTITLHGPSRSYRVYITEKYTVDGDKRIRGFGFHGKDWQGLIMLKESYIWDNYITDTNYIRLKLINEAKHRGLVDDVRVISPNGIDYGRRAGEHGEAYFLNKFGLSIGSRNKGTLLMSIDSGRWAQPIVDIIEPKLFLI